VEAKDPKALASLDRKRAAVKGDEF